MWGPTANKFRRERWVEGVGAPSPGSFFPFSYGLRNCLGGSNVSAFVLKSPDEVEEEKSWRRKLILEM